MKHMRQLYILGDIHGDFKALNMFLNQEIRRNPAIRSMAEDCQAAGIDFQALIIQCGDFAYYWPGLDSFRRIDVQADFLPGGLIPLYWIGGNHEDWDQLDRLGPGITEIEKGIFFCTFGSTLQFGPNTILLAGGADSIDKMRRLQLMAEGYPQIWWKQEGISEADMERLASVPRADIVISHTCPASFPIQEFLDIPPGQFFHEPSQDMLEKILLKYRPRRWFFGHFHQHARGRVNGCKWEALDILNRIGKAWAMLLLEWEE